MYFNRNFLVMTENSFLLVEDYSWIPEGGEQHLKEGNILSSYNFNIQIIRIIERHCEKYPELILSDDIMNLVK